MFGPRPASTRLALLAPWRPSTKTQIAEPSGATVADPASRRPTGSPGAIAGALYSYPEAADDGSGGTDGRGKQRTPQRSHRGAPWDYPAHRRSQAARARDSDSRSA